MAEELVFLMDGDHWRLRFDQMGSSWFPVVITDEPKQIPLALDRFQLDRALKGLKRLSFRRIIDKALFPEVIAGAIVTFVKYGPTGMSGT